MEDLKLEIRSVLAPAKDGLTVRQFMSDFKELTGGILSYRRYGFESVESLLRDVPDVVRIRDIGGDLILYAVLDEDSMHIGRMVRNQKSTRSKPSSKKRSVRGTSYSSRTARYDSFGNGSGNRRNLLSASRATLTANSKMKLKELIALYPG